MCYFCTSSINVNTTYRPHTLVQLQVFITSLHEPFIDMQIISLWFETFSNGWVAFSITKLASTFYTDPNQNCLYKGLFETISGVVWVKGLGIWGDVHWGQHSGSLNGVLACEPVKLFEQKVAMVVIMELPIAEWPISLELLGSAESVELDMP